jgi:hypothetical protein
VRLIGGNVAETWPDVTRPSVPSHIFLQGRQKERRVDALALRAEEGRGIAAISVGEPRAGLDPTISEWGNPTTFEWLPRTRGGHRGN